MGSILSAECNCGYTIESVFIGATRANYRTKCLMIHYCDKCSRLFRENIFKKNISCPNCSNSNVIPYYTIDEPSKNKPLIFSSSLDKLIEMENKEYICPKCNKLSLTFLQEGCFD